MKNMNLPKNLAQNIQKNPRPTVPKMYGIIDYIPIITQADQADHYDVYVNGDALSSTEIKELLKEHGLQDLETQEQIESLSELDSNILIIPMLNMPILSNFAPFLSKQAAEEHLQKHGHHYHEMAHVIELEMFRNPETRQTLNVLYNYLKIKEETNE